ncbi:exonuclease domain-containing protein [Thermocrinis sp.]
MSLIRLKRWLYKKIYREKFENFNWDLDFDRKVEDQCFVVFDTEMSGADFKKAELISLGAFRLEGTRLKLSEHINFKVKNPMHSLESVKVHGITPSELEEGLEPKQACMEFIEFSRGCALVGYFVEIDLAVMRNLIKRECNGVFLPYHIDVVDLLEIREKIPTLEELTKVLNLPLSNLHDALEDAYMTALVFLKLVKKYQHLKIGQLPVKL